ncbi:GlyGly-CTERM sorting domain-containing protein [Photobacterium phosphoreum]|uniref:GlyGly-CTERM sorting domain-containing protein n=1 Tax=Photobacterium phosphoreum TaxID=659 RepID=A0A2T3JQ62_PHOPO|nr:DUF3466 family protein [Photobacterium phosphoreum]PSU24622.1 GlyGly-CTERM sorting domain-containing protein [Photobacterium phosphoreum]PSU42346.1 GlyGly-CTERM sorting domain-containing protein [Photobacterium phosphoreum]PSU51204.1 GlyGly-CTERM sorting domain-containing protein [Photobacterium phosphoreum]
MPHKMLKLSTLAILIAGASQANAAVYTVVPVDQNSTLKDQPYFDNAQSGAPLLYSSTGIQDSGTDASCFSGDCTSETYKVTSEARRGTEGTPIADTTPYNQNSQDITNQSQLQRYCDNNLGYGTCDIWAENQFFGRDYAENDEWNGQGLGGLQKKQAAWVNGYHSNAQGLVDGAPVNTFAEDDAKYDGTQKENLGSIVANTTDSTVKGIVGTDFVYGITSSALFENASGKPRAFSKRGFVNTNGQSVQLAPVSTSNALVSNMGQTQANDAVMLDGKLLVVGSSSYAASFYAKNGNGDYRDDENKLPSSEDILDNGSHPLDFERMKLCATNASENLYANWECQFSTFANEAAYWLVNADGTVTSHAITVGNGDNRDGLAVIDKDHDSLSFQASAQAVALDKNGDPIAVGYSTNYVEAGKDDSSYSLQAAYFTASINNLTSWTRTLIPGLSLKPGDDRDFTYTIANGVNSNSVIVGDAKGNGEKPQRAFVYKAGQGNAQFFDQLAPSLFFKDSNSNAAAINNNDQVVGWVDIESSNGKEARHRAFTYINGTAQGPLKAGGAWMLDDLTNDGVVNSIANSYRIVDATGINNAGVIAATAFYCQGGYENLSKLAHCNGTEQQVVVKLVPKAGATAEDIQPRVKDEEPPFKRSGGSLGILALTALGFIGFRRRK